VSKCCGTFEEHGENGKRFGGSGLATESTMS
jgi:hypothetical protein